MASVMSLSVKIYRYFRSAMQSFRVCINDLGGTYRLSAVQRSGPN